jgi:CDP-diacylglycerol--glycerol-3-phosphate 3-phosphatidyltransferase
MLNVLRPFLARLLTPVGEALARTPVTPNAITLTGTAGVVAGALWLFPTGHLFAGTMVCTGFVLADMLDGVLARIKGTSGTWGAFLDSTLDRIADAAVFAGLAIWLARTGQGVLATVALFCLVVGGLVSYAKARAEGLGLRCDVGIAERTERLLIALVSAGLSGLGVPYVLAIGLWALAALSAVTFGQRVVAVHAAARQAPDPAEAAPEQGAPEQGGPEQGGPEQGGPEQGGPEQGGRKPGMPEQNAREQGIPGDGAPGLGGGVPPGGRNGGGSRPGTPWPPAGGRR